MSTSAETGARDFFDSAPALAVADRSAKQRSFHAPIVAYSPLRIDRHAVLLVAYTSY